MVPYVLGNKQSAEGGGFKHGQEVECVVRLSRKEVAWKVDGQVRAMHGLEAMQ